MENYIEQCKLVRKLTLAPMNKIAAALQETSGDVDKAVELLVKQKEVDATDLANRVANNNIVYSYVHNNRIGAMIVLSCQTDFVARNEVFLDLAKDLCIQVVSAPNIPKYISSNEVSAEDKHAWTTEFSEGLEKKPAAIVEKIVTGKYQKRLKEVCLLEQPFVKDDTKTVNEIISGVASTVGEKIELKKFIRITASA